MGTVSKLDLDYVSTVAGNRVSVDDAVEFLDGAEDYFLRPREYVVLYDVLKKGVLVSKTLTFPSFMAANSAAKQLVHISVTKPVVAEK